MVVELSSSNVDPLKTQPNLEKLSVEVEANVSSTKGTQHSIVTIFSIWVAMMGTSMLSMPWAIKQAGFANGIALLIVMAGIMAYTAYRIISFGQVPGLGDAVISDFCDVVRIYLGRFAEAGTLLCAVITVVGATIIYWILMSNFLYNIVIFVYEKVHHDVSNQNSSDRGFDDVVCEKQTDSSVDLPERFKRVWDENYTVPLFLVLLVFPLINFKSPTFFTKFNALGAVPVVYLMIFICAKAGKWGLNVNFIDSSSPHFTENVDLSFPAMTGVAALAYFLHNVVIVILRNQRRPEHNLVSKHVGKDVEISKPDSEIDAADQKTRDLVIAYSLVCSTYLFIGVVFYVTFPLDKSCVADNLLDNIRATDVMSLVARVCLFVQMICVLPLFFFVIRTQCLQFFFSAIWPSWKHVVVLNITVVTICVLFAVFLPKVGRIISFVGALCGIFYAIALPCLVYIIACHKQGTLTIPKIVFHCLLIAVGVANFIGQFFIM